MKLTFATQSAALQDNTALNPERLINCYSEPASPGSASTLIIKSVLGQAAFADLGLFFLRAMAEINGKLYVVAGAKLWRISSTGIATELGDVLDDEVTTISGNGESIAVTAGGNYYVWNDGISQPVDGAVTSAGSAAFIDQYTVITEKDGNRFEWSALADPTDLPGLNFATNESNNDNILRVIATSGNLWFLNTSSLEIWYNTGQGSENAFVRLSGGALNVGCMGANLAVGLDSGLFFVGDDGVCYMTAGDGLVPVSTPAIESNIKEKTPTHCFYYEDGGRKFCVVRFSDRPAWCYDLTLQAWHERSTGDGAWDVISTVKVYGKWLCGVVTGEILEMTRSNTDISSALVRRMVGRTLYMDSQRFKVPEMEILARVGTSNVVEGGETRDPQIVLRVSRDRGQTFGRERARSLGALGEYEQRAKWRNLGQFRQMTPELSISEPVEVSVYADAIVRVV